MAIKVKLDNSMDIEKLLLALHSAFTHTQINRLQAYYIDHHGQLFDWFNDRFQLFIDILSSLFGSVEESIQSCQKHIIQKSIIC